MKKTPGNIIILHKCTKSHDHVLHCSLDMMRDRCNCFSFSAIFYSFIPRTCLTARKIKISKKQQQQQQKTWRYHLTHKHQKL